MRIAIVSIALASLTACGSGSGEAEERQFEIMRNQTITPPAQELCDKAGDVAKAYLREEKKAKFEQWSAKRDSYCDLAGAEGRLHDSMNEAAGAIRNFNSGR